MTSEHGYTDDWEAKLSKDEKIAESCQVIMDLLASETARLVLSYTLDQHLPATSKQLVTY